MKNILPIVIFVAVVAGVLYFVMGGGSSSDSASSGSSRTDMASTAGGEGASGGEDGASDEERASLAGGQSEMGDEGLVDEEVRSAAEVYKTADEAIEAVKKGSADYDDIILEQFQTPGEDCTWCDQFYASLRELMTAPDTNEDQRSYYGEILAISGKPSNIAALVDLAKGAKNPDDADPYLEAIELALGEDDLTKYLGSQLDTPNESLKESLLVAITNQGSRQAAELLIKETKASKDPDGFYSKGMGIGEFIPEEEAIPLLQDLVKKRDDIAPLAVKSLLNSGISGLRIVMDELANSKDLDGDRKMLQGAVDHVNYDDEVEQYLGKMKDSSNPLQAEFAKKVLDDFQATSDESDAEGTEEG